MICRCGYYNEGAILPLALCVSEFHNEVSDHLPLNGSTWMVLYVKFAQFYCPCALRLVASGLLIARRRGLSVKTITVWA